MTRSMQDEVAFSRGPAMSNRMMLAPLTNPQSNADGTLGDDEYNWLTMRAEGGFGLVMTCASHVQKSGQGFPGQLGIWDDSHIPGLTRLAEGIHRHGSLAAVQLQHSGRRSRPDLTGEPAPCPWDDEKSGAVAMSEAQIEQLIEDFAQAAVRAEKAGFDGVELHGAHGYLLAQFLDGENNNRSDAYGGSFENRQRVLWSCIDRVRAETGPDFQLGVRLSPERFGIRLEEARQLAQSLMTSGTIDYLDMSLWNAFNEPVEAEFKSKPLIDWFTELDRGDCRLGVAGAIMDGATVQRCLDHGADFTLIGRAAIIHHDFAQRVLADPAFAAKERPLSRAWLHSEGVSETFCDYIKGTWPDFIAD